jgi:hypothetical protein
VEKTEIAIKRKMGKNEETGEGCKCVLKTGSDWKMLGSVGDCGDEL